MVLKIFLSIIFLMVIILFAFFILNILLPTLRKQALEDANPIFSPLELNFTKRVVDNKIEPSEKRAVVLAAPRPEKEGRDVRMEYNGIKSCVLFEHAYGTLTHSNWDCIGFGDCVASCPQEAIVLENGVARVSMNCCGCGSCIGICPKGLIELFPKEQKLVRYKNDESASRILETFSKKDFKLWRYCYTMFK
ncbi:MAG: hypothetical protein K2N58_10445 [Treponemataceae bacterium]|nr:hypothetical protein [Treponemataceae bacterium]